MKGIKKYLYYTLLVMSTVLILLTLFSLIQDIRYWYYKILDFPRLQYLLIGIVFLVLFVLFTPKWKFSSLFLLSGLISVLIIHGMVIYPYLLGEKSVQEYAGGANSENTFGVLLANVLIDNRESEAFLEIVKLQDPDILLAMEVNNWWANELQVLKEVYPYYMEYPLDNAYGMSLYSKLPMEERDIKFLKHDDVPSFHVVMTLPSGNSFNFHAIHPVSPIPSKKYPDNLGEKEVALLKIGEIVADNDLPSVVAGDFNDVSWSNTSRLFGEKGKLKNVRLGRGLYNTFDANSFIFRWPLDHYFVTKEFKLAELELLPKFGSDHYPLYAKFVLEP